MISTVDPYLTKLAHWAEAGADCHWVRLMVGSTIIVGKPCPSKTFFEWMVEAMRDETWERSGQVFPGRKNKGIREAQFSESVEARTEMLHDVPEANGSMLTLEQVRWLPNGGGGLEISAIRVAIESVDAWWVGGGETLSAKGGGGSFFIGAIATEE